MNLQEILSNLSNQSGRNEHLLSAQELIRIHPAFDAVNRANAHQAAADFEDIQPVTMFYFRDSRGFRSKILPQVHGDRADVGNANGRQLGTVLAGIVAGRITRDRGENSTTGGKQQRDAARSEKSGNDHRRSEG